MKTFKQRIVSALITLVLVPGAVFGASYVVQRGDTLQSIGADNGVDWREIEGHDGDPDLIRPGEVLLLPDSPAASLVLGGDGTIGTLDPWKIASGIIRPRNSSSTLRVPSLASQNCLGTDADGDFGAGTCGSGGSATTTINGVNGPTFTFNTAGTNGLSYATSAGTVTITQATSSGSTAGFLSASDWTTFNNKQAALTTGNLTATSPVSVSGARTVIGGAADISIQNAAADGSTKGAASFEAASFDASSGNITLSLNSGAAQTCTGTDKVSALSASGIVTCSADTAGSGGISSLNGSTSSTQTFATTTAASGFSVTTLNGVHTFSIADTATLASSTWLKVANNLSDLNDAGTARTNLGLAIGTNVQAYDADLTTYAGITPSANIQSLLGSADYSAARTNLGLAIGTNVQAYDADLTTYAGITPSANVQTLLGAADYAAFKTSLSLNNVENTALSTGNAGTATALAANGANCSAGSYPLGVNASGAVEDCTVAAVGTITGNSTSTYLTYWTGASSIGGTSGMSVNTSTNAITATTFIGALNGNANTVTVADAGSDTTTWPLLGTSQTGSLAPATDAGMTYNASTNALTATTFVGALTGTATGNLVAGGALGTPSSATLTNATGLPLAGTLMTAGRSLTISTNDVLADAELYTDTKCIWFASPTAADDFKSIWLSKQASTLTSIWAESDQTVTFMLQVDDGSPADVDSADLAPAAGTAEDTALNGDATMAAGDRLDIDLVSVANTPTWVSICWTFTYDD